MPQVTGARGFRAAMVEVGGVTTPASLTDISGAGTGVQVSGGSRGTGHANTFTGDIPVLDAGKLDPIDIQVRFLYTISSVEAFEITRALYEASGAPCFLRYSVGGGVVSDARFSTADGVRAVACGVMTDFLYPSGEAAGNEIVPGGFTVRCASLLKDIIP